MAAGAGVIASRWTLISLALVPPEVHPYIPDSTIAMCAKFFILSGCVVWIVDGCCSCFFCFMRGLGGCEPLHIFLALAFRWVGTPVPMVAHAHCGMGQGGVLEFGVRHSLN